MSRFVKERGDTWFRTCCCQEIEGFIKRTWGGPIFFSNGSKTLNPWCESYFESVFSCDKLESSKVTIVCNFRWSRSFPSLNGNAWFQTLLRSISFQGLSSCSLNKPCIWYNGHTNRCLFEWKLWRRQTSTGILYFLISSSFWGRPNSK